MGSVSLTKVQLQFRECIGCFSVAMTEHNDQNQLMGEMVSLGLWLQKDKIPSRWEAWQ